MTSSASVAPAVLPEQPVEAASGRPAFTVPTGSAGSAGSMGSAGSAWSMGSAGSAWSMGSAGSPEALCHGFAAAVAAGDLDAIVGLYAADAVVTLPRGREAAGHVAIRAAFEAALHRGLDLAVEAVGRPIVTGALACTTTTDAAGRVHTQVARREADASWRWIRDGSRLRESTDQEPAVLG